MLHSATLQHRHQLHHSSPSPILASWLDFIVTLSHLHWQSIFRASAYKTCTVPLSLVESANLGLHNLRNLLSVETHIGALFIYCEYWFTLMSKLLNTTFFSSHFVTFAPLNTNNTIKRISYASRSHPHLGRSFRQAHWSLATIVIWHNAYFDH